MSLDFSQSSSSNYSKSPMTDISLVSKDNEIFWYSKYQLSKISPVFLAIFLGDSDVKEIKIEHESETIREMLDFIDTGFEGRKSFPSDKIVFKLYKISHYYNYIKLEKYATTMLINHSVLTADILVEFKKCNNERYIEAVETMMIKINKNEKRTNCDVTSDVIDIYQQVLEVVMNMKRVLDSGMMTTAMKEQMILTLNTIPGVGLNLDESHKYNYVEFCHKEGFRCYDTKRNYYNCKKKRFHLIRRNGIVKFLCNDQYFAINKEKVITGKVINDIVVPITEDDKKILQQYDVTY